jgi:hypothetical protein
MTPAIIAHAARLGVAIHRDCMGVHMHGARDARERLRPLVARCRVHLMAYLDWLAADGRTTTSGPDYAVTLAEQLRIQRMAMPLPTAGRAS